MVVVIAYKRWSLIRHGCTWRFDGNDSNNNDNSTNYDNDNSNL